MKKIYKSRENKIFSGVLGGLGEYFDIDPTVLRLLWLLVVVFTGIIPGLVVYIIAAFIMPEKGSI
jgi:phage shock protein C